MKNIGGEEHHDQKLFTDYSHIWDMILQIIRKHK